MSIAHFFSGDGFRNLMIFILCLYFTYLIPVIFGKLEEHFNFSSTTYRCYQLIMAFTIYTSYMIVGYSFVFGFNFHGFQNPVFHDILLWGILPTIWVGIFLPGRSFSQTSTGYTYNPNTSGEEYRMGEYITGKSVKD